MAEDLLSRVRAASPEAVPGLLAANIVPALGDAATLVPALIAARDLDRDDAALVAAEWLASLEITNGAFWVADNVLSPYGLAVLAYAALAAVGREAAVVLPRADEPDDETVLATCLLLHRGEFPFREIDRLLTGGRIARNEPLLMLRLIRAALALAPSGCMRGRRALAEFGMERAARLQRERPAGLARVVLRESTALYGAMAGCFPPGSDEEQDWRVRLLTAQGALFEETGDERDRPPPAEPPDDAPPRTERDARESLVHAMLLLSQFEADGTISALDAALALYARVVPTIPSETETGALARQEWGVALLSSFTARARGTLRAGSPPPPEAAAHLRRAIKLFTEAAARFDALGNREGRAGCHSNLGSAYTYRFQGGGPGRDRADIDRALAAYDEAAHVYLRPEPDRWASCQLNRANALVIRFDLEVRSKRADPADITEAAASYRRAEYRFPHGTVRWADVQQEWANALYARYTADLPGVAPDAADIAESIRRFRAAADAYRTLRASGKEQRTRARLGLAHAAALDYVSAQQEMASAIAIVERTIVAQPSQDDQLFVLAAQHDMYEEVVMLCLTLAEAAPNKTMREQWTWEAWQFAERLRARITLQALQQSALATAESAGRADDARQQLLRDLAATEHALAESGDDTAAERDRIERERHAILAALQRLDPGLAALQQIETPDLRAIQRALGEVRDGAILAQFFPTRAGFTLFLITPDTLMQVRLPLDVRALRARTDAFRAARAHADRREQAGQIGGVEARAVADHDLAALLGWLGDQIGPTFALLRDAATHMHPTPPDAPDRVPHLFVLPAGDLHFVPLHALPLPDGTRLHDRFAVTLLPAAAALPDLVRQPARSGPYHGFAPPVRDLPLAPFQLAVEAALLGGTVTAGAAATLDAVRAVRGGIVAFGTHGRADRADPLRSMIQLANRDGTLRQVSAIEFLIGLDQLAAPLLLLWACETHAEGAQSGDNWLGLTRAALRAGRALVASLWPIQDDVTLVVSIVFAIGLNDGLTAPQALRRAVRAVQSGTTESVWQWGRAAYDALPATQRADFDAQWRRYVSSGVSVTTPLTDQGKTAKQRERAAFPRGRLLSVWTPYIAIGLPEPMARD